jgi:hypothetical protein
MTTEVPAPYLSDEKTTLLAALQSHRDVMPWKLDGPSDGHHVPG